MDIARSRPQAVGAVLRPIAQRRQSPSSSLNADRGIAPKDRCNAAQHIPCHAAKPVHRLCPLNGAIQREAANDAAGTLTLISPRRGESLIVLSRPAGSGVVRCGFLKSAAARAENACMEIKPT
jgi:hypothetical protein